MTVDAKISPQNTPQHTSRGYRYRTELKINTGNPVSVCDTETRNRTGSVSVLYRYRNTENTGIRLFGICPPSFRMSLYSIERRLRRKSEPQRTTSHDLSGILTSSYVVHTPYFVFFIFLAGNNIWFEDIFYRMVYRNY